MESAPKNHDSSPAESEPEKFDANPLSKDDRDIVRAYIKEYKGRPYMPGYPKGNVNQRRSGLGDEEKSKPLRGDRPNLK